MANPYGPQDPYQQHTQPYGQPQHPPTGYPQQYPQQAYGQPYHPPGYGYGGPPPPKRSGQGPVFWLLIVCAPVLLLFGCMAAVVSVSGGTTVTTQSDRSRAAQKGQDGAVQPAPVEISQKPQEKAPTQEAKPSAAAVGGTITLKGIESELRVAVTLVKVVENATPKNDFLKPKDGNRLYAVELVLNNTGSAAYSDSPSNGAYLIDAEGQQYRSTFGDVQEGVVFSGSVTMSAGDSRKGIIVFEVPKSTKISKFQFALNSGFADHKGEWLTQ